jgi:hypothetical protein
MAAKPWTLRNRAEAETVCMASLIAAIAKKQLIFVLRPATNDTR